MRAKREFCDDHFFFLVDFLGFREFVFSLPFELTRFLGKGILNVEVNVKQLLH